MRWYRQTICDGDTENFNDLDMLEFGLAQEIFHFAFCQRKIISWLFVGLSFKLSYSGHSSVWFNSALTAGMITYVSAYLQNYRVHFQLKPRASQNHLQRTTLVSLVRWLTPVLYCLTYFLRATASMLSAHLLSQFRLSVCPSVRPSVCPSHGWFMQKRLKLGSCSFHHTVAPSL